MSKHAQGKLAASNKRSIEQIDQIKSYAKGERKCDPDQLRKTKKLQKELKIRINIFEKESEQVEK